MTYLILVAPYLSLPQLQRRVRQALPEAEDMGMTLAEQLKQEGRKEGLSHGLSQGISEGVESKRALVRRLLLKKFGSPSSGAEQQLARADDASLDRLAERGITASTLDAVFSD